MARLLVVDGSPNAASALKLLFEDDGHDVEAHTNAEDALAALSQRLFDVVLTDLLGSHAEGRTIVRVARRCHPEACIFVNSARAPTPDIAEACHVFEKPLDYRALACTIAECRARRGPGRHGVCYLKSPSDQGAT
ncbi:MAG TPA: response regulator [Myxococcales bacterium]|nr:response regulator [Myxococcales bacterium]